MSGAEIAMNRKERRADSKRGHPFASGAASDGWDKAFTTDDLLAKARAYRQQGQPQTAGDICERIVAREPSHVPALNLLGLIYQDAGRHKLAVKAFAEAVTADDLNAACHYNLASSYQALDRRDDAVSHFTKAIALGMSQKNIEHFIFQNPVITACISRIEETWPLPSNRDDLLPAHDLASIANDVFLRCALESVLLNTEPLERFLTFLRSALLATAYASAADFRPIDDAAVALFCAVAQQCFINEYIFIQSNQERRSSSELRALLLGKLARGDAIPPLLLAAVAAYFPLHALPGAPTLVSRKWPPIAAGLVRRQIGEPLEEAADVGAIAVLTAIDNAVSVQVMQQYAENPYPRWTISPLAAFAAASETPATPAADDRISAGMEILIAGCGSGQHVFQVAHLFPGSRVLAVDISLPSLAYARRKTREEGLRNIEYTQADILGLGTIGRSFDRIEAVGVLHHLAEPELGWRVLLSLLRDRGEMRIGLYSEAARRAVVAVRAFIAERNYRPTADDIRECRQQILRNADKRRWRSVTELQDFHSMSGCRDLLFNVMEHRFTLPRIKTILNELRLSFLGFDLPPWTLEQFGKQFPGEAAALTNLDKWDAFEAENPLTFRHMYQFVVRRD